MDKSLLGTFALALLMGFALGVLACCYRNFLFILDKSHTELYVGIVSYIRFAVNPFLIFTVFYLHGRKLDLKAKLRSVMVLLIAGLYVGYVLGNIVTFPVITHLYQSPFPPSFLGTVLMSLFPTIIISPFFAALSASAIAYIRNIKTSSEGHKENLVEPPQNRER